MMRAGEAADAAIRSAMGSLWRAMACAPCAVWAGRIEAASGDLVAGPAGAEPEPVKRSLNFCGRRVGLAKNGAGCDPDCRKTALTMMIKPAALAHRIAMESTGRSAADDHSRSPIAATMPRRARLLRRSRTFLHPHRRQTRFGRRRVHRPISPFTHFRQIGADRNRLFHRTALVARAL